MNMRTKSFILLLLLTSTAFADDAAEKRVLRDLPRAPFLPMAADRAKWLKGHMRTALAAELKLDPRLAVPDRGYVERKRPALEQLALGLGADPPRPEYPILAAGPRATGDSLAALEVYQIPPLSRSSDAKLTLTGDPATMATRPYTAPLVTASRGSRRHGTTWACPIRSSPAVKRPCP